MAFGHYIAPDWKSTQNASAGAEKSNGCFDCNICLDLAREPVVTLCGHLYCWPCIYKWLHIQSTSLASDEHPQCPVCKASISETTMVPLYGRGQTVADSELDGKASSKGVVIPPRPSSSGTQALMSNTSDSGHQGQNRNINQNQHFNPHLYRQESTATPLLNLGGTTMTGFQMFGEMFYARVFGNSMNVYAYPNSYPVRGGSGYPRLRRQEMQAEKSLNRVSVFLFCCVLLCLFVF